MIASPPRGEAWNGRRLRNASKCVACETLSPVAYGNAPEPSPDRCDRAGGRGACRADPRAREAAAVGRSRALHLCCRAGSAQAPVEGPARGMWEKRSLRESCHACQTGRLLRIASPEIARSLLSPVAYGIATVRERGGACFPLEAHGLTEPLDFLGGILRIVVARRTLSLQWREMYPSLNRCDRTVTS